MKEQLTLEMLCGSLPFKLKVLDTVTNKQKVMNLGEGASNHWVGIKTILKYSNVENHIYKPIFRNLKTDLTREIEHNGELYSPSLINIWNEKRDIEFVITAYQYLAGETSIDEFSCRFIKELQSLHFWLGNQSYFEKKLILDINELNK